MDSEALRLLWVGTALAAGIAVVISLIAAADSIPRWSVIVLIVLGIIFFYGAAIGLGWAVIPYPNPGRTLLIRSLLLFAGIGVSMGVLGWLVMPTPARAVLHVTKTEVLLSPLPITEVIDTHAKIYFKDIGKLPIEKLRYGSRFQLSKERLALKEEDALWDGLTRAGATQKMTDSEIPVDSEQYVEMNLHWNNPQVLRQVSQGNGFLYLMVYSIYDDENGSHQTEYCGIYYWQPSGVINCYHHNRER